MKILLVKTSSMGDVIHALPAVTDLNNNLPNIEIDWVVEESFAEIPKWHKAVNNVIPIAIRRWRKNLTRMFQQHELQLFLKQLRQTKYDYIIDAQSLIKSAIIAKTAHGKTFGMDWSSAREPIASLLYQNKYAIPKNQHAVTRIRQLFAKIFNYQMPVSMPEYGIHIPSEKTGEKYIVFIPNTSRNEKLWSVENWQQLATMIDDVKIPIKIVWGNEKERQRAEMIAKMSPNIEILPKLSLTKIAGLLQNALTVVAVDTGLGHLAAAFGTPTISLYGPTNPDLIATYGENQIHIKSDQMQQITANQIWQQVQYTLKKK